ncbi:hypothetical protein ASC66_04340 [Leifsonia sp. Root4]|uniref:Gfo/Idh/MocA family protein n=1 Tax=Leifsonia sp. Root4 TaxID=1736525 RepID=UPI0006F4411D|nr:Gfo/Idh/MocA family oxidoreductase [Leifsonia sp. Root4]KQW08168.1 hypothetical protein ASC66_04340 [Leifsonia sp. Root4]
MTRTSLRWAIVGAASVSTKVVADLRRVADNQIVVVYSRDGAKAASFAKANEISRSTDDLAVLEDPDVDVVYLATPAATHRQLTERAIRAGKHVLVEKPLAFTAAEVAELFAIAREHGVFLMEGMWMKFTPAFERLLEELERGRIGPVQSVRAAFGLPAPEPHTGSRWDPTLGGGVLRDQGVYPIALAQALLGSPDTIICHGIIRDDGLDVSCQLLLRYGDGRHAQLATSMLEFSDLGAAIAGPRGWIDLRAPFWNSPELVLHTDDARRIFDEPERLPMEREGYGYTPMLRAVSEAVLTGRTQHPRHDEAATIAVFTTIDGALGQLRLEK